MAGCAILRPQVRGMGANIDAQILDLLRLWHLSIQRKKAKLRLYPLIQGGITTHWQSIAGFSNG